MTHFLVTYKYGERGKPAHFATKFPDRTAALAFSLKNARAAIRDLDGINGDLEYADTPIDPGDHHYLMVIGKEGSLRYQSGETPGFDGAHFGYAVVHHPSDEIHKKYIVAEINVPPGE